MNQCVEEQKLKKVKDGHDKNMLVHTLINMFLMN